MDQAEVEKGAGPIGVIVVPTRELAEQIHKETRRFSKAYQLRVSAAFGGLSKFEQFKDLKGGSEVVPNLHTKQTAAAICLHYQSHVSGHSRVSYLFVTAAIAVVPAYLVHSLMYNGGSSSGLTQSVLGCRWLSALQDA